MIGESKIVNFNKGLELQAKKAEQNIMKIQEGMAKLQEGVKKYEEWKKIALEQGDEESALLYEIKVLEVEVMIMDGEILCNTAEQMENERWHQQFNHIMNINSKQEKEERFDDVDCELEHVSDYLALLLEDFDTVSEETKQKIQKLQKRKEELERERLSIKNPVSTFEKESQDYRKLEI